MAPTRRKPTSTKKPEPITQNDYDKAIQTLKEVLKITPKTAKHLCNLTYDISITDNVDGMGYKTLESLNSPEITPQLLETQMQEYLERTKQTFQSAPKRSGAMYRVAFRRILWTARASEQEKESHPERMTCGYWSNKAIAAREVKDKKGLDEG